MWELFMNKRELAESIAAELLTSAVGIEATRMQLMLMDSDGVERNMGGRNKESMIRVIESHLDAVVS